MASIMCNDKVHLQADEPAALGASHLHVSRTSAGAPCWVKVDADGTETTIASAEHSALHAPCP
jgi:hypothetical protein